MSSWKIFLVCAAIVGCVQRPAKVSSIPQEATEASSQPTEKTVDATEQLGEMEKALADQEASTNQVSSEKSTLEANVSSLNEQMQTMAQQMEGDKGLSEQDKADLQTQIANMEAQKAEVEKKVAELNEVDAESKKALDALKAEIEQLKKDLAAAKAGTNNVTGQKPAAAGNFFKFSYVGQRCLDVAASGTADNVPILGYPCQQAGLNQQFVYDVRNGYFFLRSRTSNKCVAVTGTAVSSPVVQRTCTNNTDKTWQWFAVSGFTGRLRNQFTGKCMGVNTAGRIVLSECNSVYAINFSYFKI